MGRGELFAYFDSLKLNNTVDYLNAIELIPVTYIVTSMISVIFLVIVFYIDSNRICFFFN